MRDFISIAVAALWAVVIVVGLLFGGSALYRNYAVWSADKIGQAEFAQAEQNRRIGVLEAQAILDSSKLRAAAEVERAKGVAEANRIVAQGLGGPEGYLRYLYINNLEQSKGQIIYVPTEGGLPILEAGKRP